MPQFYKVRQKSTGLFFIGGRQGASFSAHGARFETVAPCKSALSYFKRLHKSALEWAKERDSWDKEAADKERKEADELRPDAFEIVRFSESEVGTV